MSGDTTVSVHGLSSSGLGPKAQKHRTAAIIAGGIWLKIRSLTVVRIDGSFAIRYCAATCRGSRGKIPMKGIDGHYALGRYRTRLTTSSQNSWVGGSRAGSARASRKRKQE